MAVECFEVEAASGARVLVNELAMRPHNSGHWTIDGSTTSQFEQHLRAVLDLPFGATGHTAPWSVMVNILGGPASGDLDAPLRAAAAAQPTAKLHLYGKSPRPGRKIARIITHLIHLHIHPSPGIIAPRMPPQSPRSEV